MSDQIRTLPVKQRFHVRCGHCGKDWYAYVAEPIRCRFCRYKFDYSNLVTKSVVGIDEEEVKVGNTQRLGA